MILRRIALLAGIAAAAASAGCYAGYVDDDYGYAYPSADVYIGGGYYPHYYGGYGYGYGYRRAPVYGYYGRGHGYGHYGRSYVGGYGHHGGYHGGGYHGGGHHGGGHR